MIVVVDYGMGNVRSVMNALEAIGARAEVSSSPTAMQEAERFILPGVGAFGEAMARLRERGLVEALERQVRERGKPILGICLGMQLLGERSFEHGEHAGLGWIAGEVRRLEPATGERVPHIGWNVVERRGPSVLLERMTGEASFYFVHSYQLVARVGGSDGSGPVTGTCAYGGPVSATVEQGHITGTQFHPEKSQKAGLQLLRNFVEDVRAA